MFSNEDYLLQLLTEAGLVSEGIIDSARLSTGDATVIEKLIQSGQLSQEEIASVLASSNALEYFDLANASIAPEVANAITDEVARRYKAIPVYDDGYALTMAIADPFDFETLDALPHVLSRELNFVVSTPDAIQQMLRSFYGASDITAQAADDSIENTEGDAPIIK